MHRKERVRGACQRSSSARPISGMAHTVAGGEGGAASEEPVLGKAEAVVAADDDVIKQRDVHQAAGPLQLPVTWRSSALGEGLPDGWL